MNQIAICFFGITRSLRFTAPSIERNVIQPARQLGNARIYAHFFEQSAAKQANGQSEGQFDLTDARLLRPDWLETEPPDQCLSLWGLQSLQEFGDRWDDDFRSLRNMVHAMHSLHSVTTKALGDDPDVVVFVRPDLAYKDSLAPVIRQAIEMRSGVFLPRWQSWGGLNDRFAIAGDRSAAEAWGLRARDMLEYCRQSSEPLHAERLLAFALRSRNVPVHPIDARAARVRASGRKVWENYGDESTAIRQAVLKRRLWKVAEITGAKALAKSALAALRRR